MTARILLVGVTTDQALKSGREVVPAGTLVIVVTDDNVCQTLVALSGSHRALKPGMSIGLGENFEFYYCGRRLRLLPCSAYRIEGEIYGRMPIKIMPAWRPQDDRPDRLSQPGLIATTARAIMELYGPMGLIACMKNGVIRQIKKAVRPA
jgi:hypothetical protein